jgi:hypothetical protein
MRTLLLVGIALTVSACGTTESIPRETLRVRAFDLSMQSMQSMGGRVKVSARSSSEMAAHHFNMRLDSALWIDPATERPIIIATSEMRSVTMRDPLSGALQGIGFGAVLGAGAGALAGGLADDGSKFNAGSGAGLGALVGIIVGEVTGLIIGAPKTYEFVPAPAE